jgi:hypothetical protein
MVKLNKKRNNPNTVGAYSLSDPCACVDLCSPCGCNCPATGISSGTVVNQLSSNPAYNHSNIPRSVTHYALI